MKWWRTTFLIALACAYEYSLDFFFLENETYKTATSDTVHTYCREGEGVGNNSSQKSG